MYYAHQGLLDQILPPHHVQMESFLGAFNTCVPLTLIGCYSPVIQ